MTGSGSKRGWLLRKADTLYIAGAYAQEAVPFDAVALEGTAGFSSHRSRTDAHRYRPCHLPIFTVQMSDLRDDVHPDYLVGRHQKVTAIGLNAICAVRGCLTPVAVWLWQPWEHDPTFDELVGHCGDHISPEPVDIADIDTLDADIEVLSYPLSRHVRGYEQNTTQHGCPCSAVDTVTARTGLPFYVSELWDFHHPRTRHSRDLLDLACIACGAVWRYDRPALSASKL